METDILRDPPTASVSLRVTEATPKDLGRGIARLDPQDLARLDAGVGDVLAIVGERLTVARAMPSRIEHRGQGLVQIDGITRGNARVGVDQRVRVARVSAHPAARLVLRPVGESLLPKRGDPRQLLRLLEALPVVTGDRVRVTLFGSRHHDFEVVSTQPKDLGVVVQPQTRIAIEGEAPLGKKSAGISYEDIGGLRKEIRRIREMVELPLRCPQLFQHLGIDAPKGVLLHGPPGTGKTLLARAVAHETDVAFLSISGPEVIHKFYGESEARLRGLFEEARRIAPCIVFIDEIDAIAPRRENVHGEVEKRVVAQLLAVMDGLNARGQVIVIAATNLPNALDPALRRPGRFDREIEIGIPDAAGRRDILEIHTRGMPLADDVDLGRLAAITHGFVGADLEALCREAAMTTLRALTPTLDFASRELPDERLSSLTVAMEHFLAARAETEPSAIRELVVEVPDVAWSEVGGLDEVKRELRDAVEWPLTCPDLLRQAGIRPPKGILLHGPPGTGKTMLARALASQSGINFISVKGPSLLSKYVGESERGVRDVFKKARQASPCIVLFDEIDALAPIRSGATDDTNLNGRVIAQLLTELDGVEELKGVLVLGTTNRKDLVDPALLRPGRFDLLLEVPMPDAAGRAAIFREHLRNKPVSPDIDAADLACQTPGFTGADIDMTCRRAALMAIRRSVDSGSAPPLRVDLTITSDEFSRAIREVKDARARHAPRRRGGTHGADPDR